MILVKRVASPFTLKLVNAMFGNPAADALEEGVIIQ